MEKVGIFLNILSELNANIWIITNSPDGAIRHYHEKLIGKKLSEKTKLKFFYAIASKEVYYLKNKFF